MVRKGNEGERRVKNEVSILHRDIFFFLYFTHTHTRERAHAYARDRGVKEERSSSGLLAWPAAVHNRICTKRSLCHFGVGTPAPTAASTAAGTVALDHRLSCNSPDLEDAHG